jgi:hypothetical protein
MQKARFITVFALAAAAGFTAANCGSSGDAGNNGTNGMNALACPSSSSSGCTAEQNKTYSDCVINACDAQYKSCLGNDYKSGTFGGPCASYFSCVTKCGCTDQACRTACMIPAECQTCIVGQLAPCVVGAACTAPTCNGGSGGAGGAGGAGGGGGGGGTCADLAACCAAMTNAQIKMACMAQYNAVKGAGGDPACNSVVSAYRAAGQCK